MSGVAIQAATTGAAFLAASENPEPRPEGIKDRVCFHWRMAPGIVSLAGSVVAVVCTVIWQVHWLHAFFVPGGVCSGYLIYLGYNFQNLQSFTENNERLEESVLTLEERNQQLLATNTQLAENNKLLQTRLGELGTTLTGLQTENLTLRGANEQLGRSMEKLSSEIRELQTIRDTLQTKASLHVSQLETLQRALLQIQASAKDDHSSFAANLKIFIEQIGHLQQTRKDFEKTGSDIEEEMKRQVEILLGSAEMLKTIFSQISAWKDGSDVQQMFKIRDELGQKIDDLQRQVGQNEGQIKEKREQIEELRKIIEELKVGLRQLVQGNADQKQNNAAFASLVGKADETFKKYETRFGTQ